MSDARGAFLVCPGCGGPMVSLDLDLEGTDAQRCQNCYGAWFDWFDGETSDLARRVPDSRGGGAPNSHSGGVCPRDGVRLEQHPYLDAGPPVDRCPECLGLFAGRPQIAALAEFHERMPNNSPEPIERTSLLARLWHAFGH